MSPEEKNGAAVRSEFAFFFESIAELYNLRYIWRKAIIEGGGDQESRPKNEERWVL